ncbi:MAG: hypothetical protein DME21_09985 [Verrucomicrobia bacterium]|nr:MAG: hypothetical protein DME21_09985 [Verrucomicrobiota bacterium]
MFWVYFTFIGLTLLSFGGLTFFYAPAMASGEPLARALCVFLATFWILRLIVAVFVFDVRPYLANWFYRLGYYLTTAVFIYRLPFTRGPNYSSSHWRGRLDRTLIHLALLLTYGGLAAVYLTAAFRV